MPDLRYLIWKTLRGVAASLICGVFVACGSKLPYEIQIKRPVALPVEKVDLGLIEFTDIDSGESVNVEQWMGSRGVSHLLLTFGSKSCTACNKKARELRDNFLSQDQMSLTGAPSNLALVGVNTDSGALQLTRRFVGSENFQFIKWSDPRGDLMVKWFLPEGRYYGVPLTVLLNRDGILWRYTNDSVASVDDMVRRAIASAGADGSNGGGSSGGGSSGGNTSGGGGQPVDPPEVPQPPALAFPGPDRMREIMVTRCSEQIDERVAGQLSTYLPLDRRVTFLHVESESCGEMCVKNREILKNKVVNSLGGRFTDQLAVGFLFADHEAGSCPVSDVPGEQVQYFSGGRDFRTVFASHFDWDNGVVEGDDGSLQINPLEKAITLGFDETGRLIFSSEGAIDERRIGDFLRSRFLSGIVRRKSQFAPGPQWNWFGMRQGDSDAGAITFDTIRDRSKYTIVNVFGESCGSCKAEMNHWSRSGGLFDHCAARPEFCQVLSLENGLPESAFNGPGPVDPIEMTVYLRQLNDRMAVDGIRIPFLMLDPYSPENDLGYGYLRRFFDGYLSARNPHLGFDFRTVIYDQEGKILGVFRAVPPEPNHADHVEAFIDQLSAKK